MLRNDFSPGDIGLLEETVKYNEVVVRIFTLVSLLIELFEPKKQAWFKTAGLEISSIII